MLGILQVLKKERRKKKCTIYLAAWLSLDILNKIRGSG